jgi:hypothetical protein
MTQLMEIRKNADSHSRLQNPAGFRTFPTRPDGGRSLTTEHFSTAAIHLSKLDFLSEGWGVPQKPLFRNVVMSSLQFSSA